MGRVARPALWPPGAEDPLQPHRGRRLAMLAVAAALGLAWLVFQPATDAGLPALWSLRRFGRRAAGATEGRRHATLKRVSTKGDLTEPTAAHGDVQETFQQLITDHRIMVFGASYCPYHRETKALFTDNDLPFHSIEMDTAPDGAAILAALSAKTGDSTVPQIFVNGQFLGGYGELLDVLERNEWLEWYEPERYAEALAAFNRLMHAHKVLLFGGAHCPFCAKAQQWLRQQRVPYHYVDLDHEPLGPMLGTVAAKVSGQQTIPNIFVNGQHLGGYAQLLSENFVSLYAAD